jgi:ABC-type uncharacterized transport system permease subunit
MSIKIYIKYKLEKLKETLKNIPRGFVSLDTYKTLLIALVIVLTIDLLGYQILEMERKTTALFTLIFILLYFILALIIDYKKGMHTYWNRQKTKEDSNEENNKQ